MATHGTLDVVVHLHRFRNVDLFRGASTWCARREMQHKQAIPHGCYSKPSVLLSTFVRDQEIPQTHASDLPATQVVDSSSEFSTRAFVIKYRDERLELNEGAQFQLLIEAKDDNTRLIFANDEPIEITLELLMAELEKPGSPSFENLA